MNLTTITDREIGKLCELITHALEKRRNRIFSDAVQPLIEKKGRKLQEGFIDLLDQLMTPELGLNPDQERILRGFSITVNDLYDKVFTAGETPEILSRQMLPENNRLSGKILERVKKTSLSGINSEQPWVFFMRQVLPVLEQGGDELMSKDFARQTLIKLRDVFQLWDRKGSWDNVTREFYFNTLLWLK